MIMYQMIESNKSLLTYNRIYKHVHQCNMIYMYVAHIICIYYTYNIYIYAYPWQKNAYKFSRFLCHRTINLAMSYELFLPFLS